MEQQSRGVHVSAGDGIVAHVQNLTAYASGEERRINELLVRLNALAGAPWQEIVRALTADIAQADYDDHPRLACVSVEDDRVAALVFGDTSLTITIDGSDTVLDGRDSSTWIDVALHGSVERIHAGTQSDSAVVGVLRDGVIPAGGFLLDTSGPIPASGRWANVVHKPAEDTATVEAPVAQEEPELASAESTAPNETPDPADDAPSHVENETLNAPEPVKALPVRPSTTAATVAEAEAEASSPAPAARGMFARIEELGRPDDAVTDDVDASAGGVRLFGSSPFSPSAAPGTTNGANGFASHDAEAESAATAAPGVATLNDRSQVRGVLCMAGHLTAPNETSCRTCGQPVAADAQAVTGARPALGVLTFDDGAALTIDRPAAIGANVPTGYAVDNEPATIVRLDDGVGGVSDVQLEVRLSGWDVEIVDMQSTNGTYTMLRGERQTRTKLRAGQSVTLQAGMTVETGGRSFVYSVGTASA